MQEAGSGKEKERAAAQTEKPKATLAGSDDKAKRHKLEDPAGLKEPTKAGY